MQRLWRALSKSCWPLFAACVIGGCATYQPSAQVSPDFKPRDVAPTLPDMLKAHRQGAIEFISARGAKIPVRVFGTNGTRRPVIMTHGLESHSGWFVQSAAFMAGLGHPVYLADRRGSGLSRERRGHSDNFHQWSKDLESVARFALGRHHTNKLHVIGHCFGAIPATVFAIEHSNMVASLILPTPGFVTTTDLALSQKLHVLGDHLNRRSHYLPVPLATEQFTDQEAYQEFIRRDELKLREVTTAFYWNVNGARKFVRGHRDEVRCPVWMGLAGRDEIIRSEPTRELFREFASDQKKLVVFPEAKHILEFSPEREAFFRELENWLREGAQ
jgi:alpha-beta hydrolase superfamily lysophospholipase